MISIIKKFFKEVGYLWWDFDYSFYNYLVYVLFGLLDTDILLIKSWYDNYFWDYIRLILYLFNVVVILLLAIKHREKYDIAIARAVAPLNILLEYLMPFAKVNGKCLCMKGSNSEEEIKNSKNAIKVLGGEFIKTEEFYIPNTDIKRRIVQINKVKETNNKYPRKAGTPSKEPL